jgi:cell division protein FtsN
MKNTETGEFELVLGNRQLLSGFFVVVVLFAVFFVMGYIVGRNSSPPARMAATNGSPAAAQLPVPSETRPQADVAAPAAQNPAASPEQSKEKTAENAGAAGPQPTTQPATQPAQEPAQKSETAAPSAAAPAEAASAAAAEAASGGTYLQVVSVREQEAELVAHTLRDKGFPSSLSPGPPGRTRVLVGPYSDLGKLGEAKAGLERLGFHPIVKK